MYKANLYIQLFLKVVVHICNIKDIYQSIKDSCKVVIFTFNALFD